MNLTYKEIFLQQKGLQQTLYGKFGYKIDSMTQVVQKKKKNDHYPVTANIKLRRVAQSLYKNQRIEQVQKQIEDLRKDRKRRQQQQIRAATRNTNNSNTTQQTDTSTSKYMQKLSHIINHYNYLIDHKHIKQKDSEQARKMMNIQPKTQAEKAIEEINQLKEKLLKAGSFQEQFVLNKRINQLYRLFKDRVDEKGGRKRVVSEKVGSGGGGGGGERSGMDTFRVMSRMYQESRRGSSIASRFDHHYLNNSTKPNQKQLLNLTMAHSHQPQISNTQKMQPTINKSHHQGIHQLRKIKSHNAVDDFILLPHHQQHNNHHPELIRTQLKSQHEINKEKKKNQQLQKSISEPYVSQEFIENGKKLDVKIKNNSEALELWKGRIAEAVSPQTTLYNNNVVGSKHTVDKSDSEVEFMLRRQEQKFYNRINDTDLDLKDHVPYIENKKTIGQETVESLKRKNVLQEEILSGLLEKKNCKYLKPWGTKILVKYNAAKQAKDMLGMSPTKDPLNQTSNNNPTSCFKSSNPLHKKANNPNLSLSFNHPNHQPQSQQQQSAFWNNQIDEQYYWTMCKNEKINLLLKGKRRR